MVNTDKEKLDLCIKFLNKLVNIDKYLNSTDIEQIKTEECYDDEDDGMEHIYLKEPSNNLYYSKDEIDKISDEAWHILADVLY